MTSPERDILDGVVDASSTDVPPAFAAWVQAQTQRGTDESTDGPDDGLTEYALDDILGGA